MIRIYRVSTLVSRLSVFRNSLYGLQSKKSLSNQTEQSNEENQQPNLSEEQFRKKILENSLKFVSEYGFTHEALTEGALAAGISSASVNGMFTNGAFDLIDFFYKKSNQDMSVYLENLVKAGKITKKNDLIRSALLYRLSLIQPYIKHWPKAMAIQSFYPANALQSIENLLRLCDEVWYQLGDTSTDFNWYSKRLTLALMFKSTELFMIQDTSENFTETVKFLDSRFNDLANFYKLNQEVKNLEQAVTGTFAVLKNVLNIRN